MDDFLTVTIVFLFNCGANWLPFNSLRTPRVHFRFQKVGVDHSDWIVTPPQMSQVQSVCEMEAVAVSSTMEAPGLDFECAPHDDKDDDEDHEREGWAKNVTEKEVMEQNRTITMVVQQVNVNTEASVKGVLVS